MVFHLFSDIFYYQRTIVAVNSEFQHSMEETHIKE